MINISLDDAIKDKAIRQFLISVENITRIAIPEGPKTNPHHAEAVMSIASYMQSINSRVLEKIKAAAQDDTVRQQGLKGSAVQGIILSAVQETQQQERPLVGGAANLIGQFIQMYRVEMHSAFSTAAVSQMGAKVKEEYKRTEAQRIVENNSHSGSIEEDKGTLAHIYLTLVAAKQKQVNNTPIFYNEVQDAVRSRLIEAIKDNIRYEITGTVKKPVRPQFAVEKRAEEGAKAVLEKTALQFGYDASLAKLPERLH